MPPRGPDLRSARQSARSPEPAPSPPPTPKPARTSPVHPPNATETPPAAPLLRPPSGSELPPSAPSPGSPTAVAPAPLSPPSPRPIKASATRFLGVLAAGVRHDRATIWTRLDGPGSVRLELSEADGARRVVTDFRNATIDTGYNVHLPISGLRPHTAYRYRVRLVGTSLYSEEGRFRTAPRRDVPVRIAFSADLATSSKYHDLFDDLTKSGAQLYLSLGDWPYADLGVPAYALEDYRKKHQESRNASAVRAWMRTMAIHATWDDHEAVNDWDAGTEAANPLRIAAAKRAWREFFPVRGASRGEIYRRHLWGPKIEIFILDTRSHRDANYSVATEEKTMLGRGQRAWLLKGLRDSKAAFKLVVTSVPLVQGTTGRDRWASFAAEKNEILRWIQDHQIPGVVFLTGDQHWFAAHHLPEGPKEFQAGPLAQYMRRPNRRVPVWVAMQRAKRNFVTLDYLPGAPPTLAVTAWGNRGKIIYVEQIQAGVGEIWVRTRHPDTRWTLTGAHIFAGRGTRQLPWATPGDYLVTWRRGRDRAAPEIRSFGRLVPGGQLNLEEPVGLAEPRRHLSD